jgi:O-antigen/teichoic acid export membrane protein
VGPFIPGQSHEVVVALRILSLTLVPAALFNVCTAVLRGVAMMGAYAAVGVAAAAVQLAAIAVFVGPGAGIIRTTAVLLGAQVVVALAVWALAARRIRELRSVPRPSAADVGDMARASTSVGVLGLLGILYQRLGAIAVSVVIGPVATGWFAGASRIVEASKTAHLAMFSAVYPAMAEAHVEGDVDATPDGDGPDLGWSWRVCLGLGGVVTAGLLVLGPFLIDRLYGPTFGPSRSGLAILALTVIPSTVATYTSLALLAAHREGETLRVLLISLAVLLVLLAVLLPTVGWMGACWAVLGADTTQASLMLLIRAGGKSHLMARPDDAMSPGAGLGRGGR